MKSRLMISVAAIALIAGASFANAQGGTKSESGRGATMQQNAPSGGAGATTGRESAPSQAQSPSEKSPSATKGQRAEEKMPGATKSQSAEEQTPGAKKGMSSDETKGNMKAEGREGQKGNMKAEGKEGRETGKSAAEGREGRDSSKSAAEGREGQTTTNKNAESQNGRTQTTIGQAGAGAKLSTEQRTKITTVIRNEHVAPVTNVNFSVAVGTRVPREGVSFRPLPAEVVTIYPEWRGYEFILVRNEILVIDPATYEIVAILPA
jgi:hypothetical protein